MYQVIIVEDDPMVAEIDKQYVEHNSKMAIAGIFQNGQDALDFVRTHPVDLIMLDYYMPVMDGRTFLVKLRAEGILADVIMVTAASEARHVSELYSYGVSDYLIKPFDYNRFQTALQKFVARKEAFSGDKAFNQESWTRSSPRRASAAASLWTRVSTRSPWRSSAPSCGSTRAKSSPSKTSPKTSPSPE